MVYGNWGIIRGLAMEQAQLAITRRSVGTL